MIPFAIQIPLNVSTTPLLMPDIDPTYFFFKELSFISPHLKLFLRIITVFIATFHGSLSLSGFLIFMGNVIRAILICFKFMLIPKSFLGQISSRSIKFLGALLKYRQLQIYLTVANQALQYFMPVGLFIALVMSCACGYFVIKLAHFISFVFTLISIFAIILVFLAVHVLVTMGADITLKSRECISYWELKGFSAHRKRLLKSCRPLALWVGPFFVLEKETRANYLSLIIYNTISLIISL